MSAEELLRELIEALEEEVYPTFPNEATARAFIKAKAGQPIGHSIAVKDVVLRAKQLLGSTESIEDILRRFGR